MIVDPNQYVTREGVWVPSEWDIGLDGTVHLVGGPRAHEQPVLVDQTATPVLQAALPLLARLERPALLLPGQRLQAVVKAQRILVPPVTADGSGGEPGAASTSACGIPTAARSMWSPWCSTTTASRPS